MYEAPIPIKDILEKNGVEERFFLRDEDMSRWIYAKGAKKELRHKRDGSEYYFSEGAVQFPEQLDRPARTILTSESSVGRSSHVVTDFSLGRLRTLTPLECERLNGFPDNWTNTGMPEKMRYFCMGNALVVKIVQRIAEHIIKMLEDNE
jgi:DNA (cytosine-5)-methyltransferase 1